MANTLLIYHNYDSANYTYSNKYTVLLNEYLIKMSISIKHFLNKGMNLEFINCTIGHNGVISLLTKKGAPFFAHGQIHIHE